MARETIKLVSVPNLKSFGRMKTELWAKEVGRIFLLCYIYNMGRWKNTHQHGCRIINVRRFPKL